MVATKATPKKAMNHSGTHHPNSSGLSAPGVVTLLFTTYCSNGTITGIAAYATNSITVVRREKLGSRRVNSESTIHADTTTATITPSSTHFDNPVDFSRTSHARLPTATNVSA